MLCVAAFGADGEGDPADPAVVAVVVVLWSAVDALLVGGRAVLPLVLAAADAFAVFDVGYLAVAVAEAVAAGPAFGELEAFDAAVLGALVAVFAVEEGRAAVAACVAPFALEGDAVFDVAGAGADVGEDDGVAAVEAVVVVAGLAVVAVVCVCAEDAVGLLEACGACVACVACPAVAAAAFAFVPIACGEQRIAMAVHSVVAGTAAGWI